MWGMGVALCGGMTMNFPETLETVADDFREIGPTIVITSSRFWEDLASKIRVKINDSGWIKRRLFLLSERIGEAVVDRESKKQHLALSLHLLHRLASRIMYDPLLDRVGCSQIRAAITGGHPISPDVIRFFRAKGLNLKHAYGLTEGVCYVTGSSFDGKDKVDSAGKVLPGWKARIVSDDGRELPSNQAGEIVVKGPMMAGYYNNPQATAEVIKDGWLHTGDVVVKDSEGFYYFLGRTDDMFISGGENIFPGEIEDFLHAHPSIRDVAAIGLPDDRLGEVVAVVISVVPGKTFTEEEVLKYCEKLPKYKKTQKSFLR
jgi:long-chain acyl-CoA synthetase